MDGIKSRPWIAPAVRGQLMRQLQEGLRVTDNELNIRLILLEMRLDDTNFLIDNFECHSNYSW